MTAENRKLAIVKAALPLFARKGFSKTTTKELAQAAGLKVDNGILVDELLRTSHPDI